MKTYRITLLILFILSLFFVFLGNVDGLLYQKSCLAVAAVLCVTTGVFAFFGPLMLED